MNIEKIKDPQDGREDSLKTKNFFAVATGHSPPSYKVYKEDKETFVGTIIPDGYFTPWHGTSTMSVELMEELLYLMRFISIYWKR